MHAHTRTLRANLQQTYHLISFLALYTACAETGKHCCDVGAPFTCCCSQFKEESSLQKKSLSPIHDATNILNSSIPEIPHSCNETGQHCCAVDAPFSCCCSMFKESPHKVSASARKLKKALSPAMARFSKSFFGHRKADGKMRAWVVHDKVTQDAMKELQEIKAFETNSRPKHVHDKIVHVQGPGQGQGHAAKDPSTTGIAQGAKAWRAVGTATGIKNTTAIKSANTTAIKSAKNAAEVLREKERIELEDAVNRIGFKSAKERNAHMPTKIKAVQTFAQSYFGHDQQNDALRKQLFKYADAPMKSDDIDMPQAVTVSKDGKITLGPKLTALQNLGSESAAITAEALQELQKDKKLTESQTENSGGTSAGSGSKSSARGASVAPQPHVPTRKAAFGGSPSDSSAREWRPPNVNFGNMF